MTCHFTVLQLFFHQKLVYFLVFDMRFLLISLLLLVPTFAHVALLPPRGKQCFFEVLKAQDELAVTFQIGDRAKDSTEQLTADFWIKSPSGRILEKLSDVSHGEVQIKANEPGKFEYCFSNEGSSLQTKDVTFNVHGVVYVDVNDNSDDNLDSSVRKLMELVYDVKNEQNYIVVRERTHRNTAESTNSRVKYWSVFQLIVVILNSLFQVFYLKRFFEVKTAV
nr:Emp24p [Ogataea polymorpha]